MALRLKHLGRPDRHDYLTSSHRIMRSALDTIEYRMDKRSAEVLIEYMDVEFRHLHNRLDDANGVFRHMCDNMTSISGKLKTLIDG